MLNLRFFFSDYVIQHRLPRLLEQRSAPLAAVAYLMLGGAPHTLDHPDQLLADIAKWGRLELADLAWAQICFRWVKQTFTAETRAACHLLLQQLVTGTIQMGNAFLDLAGRCHAWGLTPAAVGTSHDVEDVLQRFSVAGLDKSPDHFRVFSELASQRSFVPAPCDKPPPSPTACWMAEWSRLLCQAPPSGWEKVIQTTQDQLLLLVAGFGMETIISLYQGGIHHQASNRTEKGQLYQELEQLLPLPLSLVQCIIGYMDEPPRRKGLAMRVPVRPYGVQYFRSVEEAAILFSSWQQRQFQVRLPTFDRCFPWVCEGERPLQTLAPQRILLCSSKQHLFRTDQPICGAVASSDCGETFRAVLLPGQHVAVFEFFSSDGKQTSSFSLPWPGKPDVPFSLYVGTTQVVAANRQEAWAVHRQQAFTFQHVILDHPELTRFYTEGLDDVVILASAKQKNLMTVYLFPGREGKRVVPAGPVDPRKRANLLFLCTDEGRAEEAKFLTAGDRSSPSRSKRRRQQDDAEPEAGLMSQRRRVQIQEL